MDGSTIINYLPQIAQMYTDKEGGLFQSPFSCKTV